MRCPQCDAEIKAEDKFCSSCGAHLETVSQTQDFSAKCPHCGVTLEENDEYCGSCGREVQRPGITEARKHEVKVDVGGKNPYPLATFLGYAMSFISVFFMVLGNIALHQIVSNFLDDDTGFIIILWAVLGLLIGMGAFGGYLLSRKHPLATHHGKRIIFLSIFMIIISIISIVAAFIMYE